MFPNKHIPAPLAVHAHDWDADPLFRGAYANWPPSFRAERHTNLHADVARRLWFAGEAGSKLYFGVCCCACGDVSGRVTDVGLLCVGYLHGAYFEGRDVALKVARCVSVSHERCEGFEHVKVVRNSRPYDIDYSVEL